MIWKRKRCRVKKKNGRIKTYQCTRIRIDVAFIWMAFKDPKLKRMGHLTKSFALKIVLLHLHSVIIWPLTAYRMNPTFIFSFPSISFSKHKINLKRFRRCLFQVLHWRQRSLVGCCWQNVFAPSNKEGVRSLLSQPHLCDTPPPTPHHHHLRKYRFVLHPVPHDGIINFAGKERCPSNKRNGSQSEPKINQFPQCLIRKNRKQNLQYRSKFLTVLCVCDILWTLLDRRCHIAIFIDLSLLCLSSTQCRVPTQSLWNTCSS